MPAPLPAVPPPAAATDAGAAPPLTPEPTQDAPPEPDPERPEPTPTGYALLGLLSFGQELSGYELKHLADSSLRFFWSAPAMSQVYRELERLADGGYVEQRNVVRDGSRSTKVYRLAPAGERAVRRWLTELPQPPVLKHPVALRVFFGHLLDPDDLRRVVEAHRQWCEQMLSQLADVREELSDDPAWRNAVLVTEWGVGYYRGELAAADRIAEATRDDPAPSAP